MAATALTPIQLVPNGSVANSLTAIVQADGAAVADANPDKLLLHVTNTYASGAVDLTIKASDKVIPAWMAGQGDLVVSLPATTGDVFAGPFDSARFLQSDGSVQVEFAANFAGKITAIALP